MNINLTAPTRWGELTVDQFRMVVKTILLHLTESERLLVLFCQLTGVKMVPFLGGPDFKYYTDSDGHIFKMENWQVVDFCDRLRWLIDTVPDELPNPTKKDAYLRDISFGDWFEADTQFRLYEDDHDLAHFEIILPKLDEEPHEIDEAEAVVLKMWWNCVMGQIGPMYPNVFAKSEGNGGAFNPFKSLQEMHLLLNDDHPQENEKIDNSRLHDVLSALDSVIAKLKAREAEYNKIRRP